MSLLLTVSLRISNGIGQILYAYVSHAWLTLTDMSKVVQFRGKKIWLELVWSLAVLIHVHVLSQNNDNAMKIRVLFLCSFFAHVTKLVSP